MSRTGEKIDKKEDSDLLENGNREGSRFSSTGLGLRNNVVTLDDGNDSTLLNS